jgi:hypothetical protein
MDFVSLRYTYRLAGGGDRVRFAGTDDEVGDAADAAPGS